ncbi:hypothetical protein Acsp02_01670 [Actinoplanes sp. NBRC 103695]|nr:hypothetical protein Acsp02_01670 [Actinoplanes sp. NBRC 103695]
MAAARVSRAGARWRRPACRERGRGGGGPRVASGGAVAAARVSRARAGWRRPACRERGRGGGGPRVASGGAVAAARVSRAGAGEVAARVSRIFARPLVGELPGRGWRRMATRVSGRVAIRAEGGLPVHLMV